MQDQRSQPGGGSLDIALKALDDGQVDQAIQLLQLAASLNPANAEAHFHLGRAYLQKESLPLAEASLRRVLALRPEDAPALCALGQTLFQRHDPEGAREVLERAASLDPDCREARDLLDVLPRPEDRAILTQIPELALVPRPAAGVPPMVRRTLTILGILILVGSALLLAQAFVRVHVLSLQPPPAGDSASTVPPARPAETETAATPPPDAAPARPADAEAAGASGAAQPEAAPPVTNAERAMELLRQIAAAQEQHHAARQQYATLAGLQAEGLLARETSTGPPLERYGYAILSESIPTPNTFRVTATLGDGSSLVVDQTGQIAPP